MHCISQWCQPINTILLPDANSLQSVSTLVSPDLQKPIVGQEYVCCGRMSLYTNAERNFDASV